MSGEAHNICFSIQSLLKTRGFTLCFRVLEQKTQARLVTLVLGAICSHTHNDKVMFERYNVHPVCHLILDIDCSHANVFFLTDNSVL